MAAHEHFTVLTRKGQITVPIEIRRQLHLKQGDKLALVLEDDHVRLSRRGSVTARTAGMLASNQPPLSAREEKRAAEEIWVEEAEGSHP